MSLLFRFTILAYGITWLALLPLILQSRGILPLGISGHWHGLAALGPLGAAYIMHRARNPGFRFRDLYGRQRTEERVWVSTGARLPGARTGWVAVGPVSIAGLVLSPILFLGIALAVAFVAEGSLGDIETGRFLRSPALLIDLLVISVVYGFGEEPGWRGWLLPHLEQRYNPLRSTLIVAVIWMGWHAPFLLPGSRIQGAAALTAFFIGIMAGAFWLTFLFHATGGSVVAASLWHMLWNAALVIAGPSATAGRVIGLLLVAASLGAAAVVGRVRVQTREAMR